MNALSSGLDGLYGTGAAKPRSSATTTTPAHDLAQQVRLALRAELRKLRELEERFDDVIESAKRPPLADGIEPRLSAIEQQLLDTCSTGAFKQFQSATTTADEDLHQRINALAATYETQYQNLSERLEALAKHQKVNDTAQRLEALTAETGVQQQRVAKNIADINSNITALTQQVAAIQSCTCASRLHRAEQSLGFIDFAGDAASDTLKALLKTQYRLQALNPNQADTTTALQQHRIHTLVYPEDCGGSVNLNSNRLYNDFVKQGGRLIFCLHQTNIDSCINPSFHWTLKHTSHHNDKRTLTRTDLNTPAPRMLSHTGCVSRSSLPSNAKVFLHQGDDVAGFYLRHGQGEVIGIGYDWESGSDSAWDALLRGLINGNALSYQDSYSL